MHNQAMCPYKYHKEITHAQCTHQIHVSYVLVIKSHMRNAHTHHTYT